MSFDKKIKEEYCVASSAQSLRDRLEKKANFSTRRIVKILNRTKVGWSEDRKGGGKGENRAEK